MDNLKSTRDIQEKMPGIQRLLQDMVSELRFRGCDENHKLIKQAHELNEWLEKLKKTTS